MTRRLRASASDLAILRMLAGSAFMLAPLLMPQALHAQQQVSGQGGAGGAHGISKPIAGGVAAYGTLTNGGGGGGGGGAEAGSNQSSAAGSTGGKGGSGAHKKGGGDGGTSDAPFQTHQCGSAKRHAVAHRDGNDGCNGAHGVAEFDPPGHDGGSGGGGGGGATGLIITTPGTVNNLSVSGVAGGKGGHGGTGGWSTLAPIFPPIPFTSDGAAGGGGGGGGGGGYGVVTNAAGIHVWTQGSVVGGNGGNGGNGGDGGQGSRAYSTQTCDEHGVCSGINYYPGAGGNGGGGGQGGAGGAGAWLGFNVSTQIGSGMRIAGGTGGNGGAGGAGGQPGDDYGYSLPPNDPGRSGADGRGGVGGDGLQLGGSQRITIDHGAVIQGGNGGVGANDAAAGAGGAGINAGNLSGGVTIVNAGSIAGGTSGDGAATAAAILFASGGNRLELQAGSQISGNVIAAGNRGRPDTLALGGSTNGTFDLSGVGAQYQGFGIFEKNGPGDWTVSGTPTAFTGDLQANGGGLVFSGATKLTTANGYVGYSDGSNAFVTVLGGGASWLNTNLFIGYRGNGTLLVAGGHVTAATASIGNDSTRVATGRVEIDGAGAVLDARVLKIGAQSFGALSVSNGGVAKAGTVYVGDLGIGGALTIGADAGTAARAAGSISGTVVLAHQGALNFNHTGSDYLFNNVISGNGVINVLGGTTVLSGRSAGFTGDTTIRNASLQVAGLTGGTTTVGDNGRLGGNGTVGHVTVAQGGTLAPNGSGELTVNGNLTLSPGGAFDFHLGHSSIGGSTTSATVRVNGDLALAGATLNVDASGEPAIGYYRMMTYTGAGPAPGDTMVLGRTPPDSGPFDVIYAVDTQIAQAVDLVVIPDGVNVLQTWVHGAGPWTSTSNSWFNTIGGIVPAPWGSKYGVFRGIGDTVSIEGSQSFAGLQFAGGTYSLVAGAGGVLRPTAFDGSDGIGELRVLANESATISAPIVGAGGINKTGGGTLVLAGTSTYTGGTTISGGTLQISSDANLGSSGSLTFDNGILHTTGNISWTRNVSLLGIGEIDTDAGTSLIFTNTVSGAGSLIKTGAGALVLTQVNGWTGGTVLEAGTLQLGNFGALPNGSDVVVYGGKLDLNGYDTTTRSLIGFGGEIALSSAKLTLDQAGDTVIASTISGIGGSVVKTGSGTLLLSGTNTYTGGTTVAGGTVAISADANLGTGTLTLSGGRLFTLGDIASSRAIQLAGSGTIDTLFGTTFSTTGNVLGPGTLTKDGAGTLVLAGASVPGGGTVITAGTLQVGNGGVTGTLSGNVINNGVLAFNRADTWSYTDIISGSGALVHMGGGITVLTNTNTYSGGTLIANGTLQLSNGGSILGDVVNNGTLQVQRSDVYTFGGTISGTGQFRNVGPGTTILTGDNHYSGGTMITQGALQIGDGGLAGSIIGDVINNGALIARRDGLLTLAGAISGVGSFTQSGVGITRLDGLNTYTGATDVTAGTLSVNGSIASSSLVSVERGATLGGNGVVSTTQVADGGMLSPGNSVGLLTVQGNLTFASAASYMVEVSGASADRTNITGVATLGNATVRVSFDPAAFVRERYTILNAAGGVSGTFRSGVYSDEPPSFVSTLSYDANNVYLNVDLKLTGLNINQNNIAASLNTYFGTHGGIPYALGAMAPEDLTQSSGELSTGVQQNTVQAMTQFMGVLTDPFAANRGLAISGNASSAFASAERPAASWRDAYGAITKAAPAAPVFESRWNVWAAGFGGGQSTDGNSVVGSHHSNSRIGGVAVGADSWLSPQTLAGFAMAGGGTSFGLSDNLGTGHSDLFQIGGFVRHHEGPAYISAALAYGWQNVTTERLVTIIDADRLRANFTAHALSARVEVGHRSMLSWLGGVGVTPYAAGQATNIDLPAYAETLVSGGNNFALAYAARNVTATRSELGLRMDQSFALDRALLTLRGRAAWAHDFNRDRVAQASFQSLPGASFIVNGAAMAPDAALTSASAEVMLGSGLSFAVTYEGEFSSLTRSHAGKGVVRFVW
ncbi:autotransporter-associated beta strand repeat-containing protein [Tardiphaga sp.]|jgi:fibronectin-binding autotransporter adhesin|uniref:autotransporter-associated beta strand repeat-containing protein n=1 Tax=Tardiphaga sp. TaxID=1926292 RepID=UPI0037D9DE46